MADRPARHSREIVQAACRSILPEIVEWNDGLEPCSLDALVRAADDNGFEFARNLDRYVSPDAQLVEILEGFSSHTWAAHDEALKAWVSENAVVVPFVDGQRGRVQRWNLGEGQIDKVDRERATMTFRPDAEREKFALGGGVVVNPEDFIPADATEGGAV